MLLFSGIQYLDLKKNMEFYHNWFTSQEAMIYDDQEKLSPYFWKPPPPSYDICLSFDGLKL
jgi:hypothetical protein